MAFEQIQKLSGGKFAEPTITIGKVNIFFNKACIEPANLSVMKAVDIFWDEASRILKLKPVHIPGENSFALLRPSGGSGTVACSKFINRIRAKNMNGRLHLPVRWDEKEKAFIGVVGKTK